MNFNDLPVDCLRCVFDYLKLIDKFRCLRGMTLRNLWKSLKSPLSSFPSFCLVCKTWKAILEDMLESQRVFSPSAIFDIRYADDALSDDEDDEDDGNS